MIHNGEQNTTLASSILVPFPVESCLSGVGKTAMYLWYRLVFDVPWGPTDGTTYINFGAVDWTVTGVWLNGVQLGTHVGGYDPFSFQLSALAASGNELIVAVYDPSDAGVQPNGKQRAWLACDAFILFVAGF